MNLGLEIWRDFNRKLFFKMIRQKASGAFLCLGYNRHKKEEFSRNLEKKGSPNYQIKPLM